MSKLYEKFKTNEDIEENGVWANFGDGVRVKIRRLKSRASLAARDELNKPFQNEIRRGSMDPKITSDLVIKQVAKGVIADWEGVYFPGSDEAVPYTPENAYKILNDLPEFLDMVVGISAEADNYKIGAMEAAKGNF